MENIPAFFSSTFGLVVMAIFLLLIVSWTLLSIAVFGLKKKLHQLIEINREIHGELVTLNQDLSTFSDEDEELMEEEEVVTMMPKPGVQFCDNCGQKTSASRVRCTHCGADLYKEPSIQ